MLSGYQRFFYSFFLALFCVFTTDYLRYQMQWWLFCLWSLIFIPPHSCTFLCLCLSCLLYTYSFNFLGAFSDITFLSFSDGYCARIRKYLYFYCIFFVIIPFHYLPYPAFSAGYGLSCSFFFSLDLRIWVLSVHMEFGWLNEQGWMDELNLMISSPCQNQLWIVDVVILHSCRCIALVE